MVSGTGGLIKSGGGALILDNNNVYTGGTTLASGSLVLNATSATGTNDIYQTAAANLVIGANSATGPGNVHYLANGSISAGNAPGSIAGMVFMNTGNNSTLYLIDNTSNPMTLNTVYTDSSTALTGSTLDSGNKLIYVVGSGAEIANLIVNTSATPWLYLRGVAAPGTPFDHLAITNSANLAAENVGLYIFSGAAVDLVNGTLTTGTGQVRIGGYNTALGTFGAVNISGSGVFNAQGLGEVLYVGCYGANVAAVDSGFLTLTDTAQFLASGTTMFVATSGFSYGQVSQSGSSLLLINGLTLGGGAATTDNFATNDSGIYNLYGGTLSVGSGGITAGEGNSTSNSGMLNFYGGVLQAWSGFTIASSGVNPANSALTISFQQNALINPNSNTITFNTPLSGPSGLSVVGSGTVVLGSSGNSYGGGTSIAAGHAVDNFAGGSAQHDHCYRGERRQLRRVV